MVLLMEYIAIPMTESDTKNLETALVRARNHCKHKINICIYRIDCTVHKLKKLGEMYQTANVSPDTPESIADALLLWSDIAINIKKQVEYWNMPDNFTRIVVIDNIAEGVEILDRALTKQNRITEIFDDAIRDSPFCIVNL